MDLPSWAPDGIDITRPSTARVYDYILGGAHNFAVDRAMADEMVRTAPELVQTLRANRVFLRRAVRFLAGQGVRQFLDIGTGVPTVSSVHEVAQQEAAESTVVYVDIDPVAVAHSQAILAGNERAGVLCADLRDLDLIVAGARELELIDFHRPVAVLLSGILHFLPDADHPAGLVARLRDRLAPGSYVVIVHTTLDGQRPGVVEARKLASRTPTPVFPRSRPEILKFFDGLDLVDPGLVFIPQWRPGPGERVDRPERSTSYAGIGRV